MKLKRLNEDFKVEEQYSLPISGGPFAVYRLTKQSLGTLEAVDAIRKKWNLQKGRIAFAGLKDKHAHTIQHVTIHHGPRKNLSQSNLSLDYLGQSPRPIHARDITSNRFVIALRDLTDQDIASVTSAIQSVAQDGLPNFFDNQRFGSLGESGEFIAKPWCLGDYERVLWLALADDNVHDRPDDRQEKQCLREHWGQWQFCLTQLGNPIRRAVIDFLSRHPTDFRRAITCFPHELRSLWLAAFQSHLWNQVLAKLIHQICGPTNCIHHAIGPAQVPFFQELSLEARNKFRLTVLPLPSARLHFSDESLKPLYDDVCAAEGLELRQVRVKYPRDTFFSKGERPAICHPGELQYDFSEDEVYPGRRKLVLQFTLPRGAYATILLKKILGTADDKSASGGEDLA